MSTSLASASRPSYPFPSSSPTSAATTFARTGPRTVPTTGGQRPRGFSQSQAPSTTTAPSPQHSKHPSGVPQPSRLYPVMSSSSPSSLSASTGAAPSQPTQRRARGSSQSQSPSQPLLSQASLLPATPRSSQPSVPKISQTLPSPSSVTSRTQQVQPPSESSKPRVPTESKTTGTLVPVPSGSSSSSSSSRVRDRKPKPPMTPAEVMKKYANKLTPFEQSEILEYHQIYFVGNNATKIKGIPHTANNNGYDDERGDYRVMMNDHLEYRYEVLSVLGRGSFGQVLKVLDHKKDMPLALKIIRNKKRFHHQALVEVKILEHLMSGDKEHKSNIVRVYGYFYFRNHLCITFEPLSINLYEFIKNNHFKGVSLSLIRRFAIQLLQALKFLKRERIIHCDLKPENILLKSPNKPTVKLIDFGSSCFINEKIYTYIQSRFYRSPEVILGLSYDYEIDMWSFGCILSELYTGYPLFPGENEMEQMQCIMEVLGPPPKKMIQVSQRKKHFFGPELTPLLVPNSRGKVRQPGSKDLATATRCNDPYFLSFLRRCLKWDPKTRLQPEKALEHHFITEGRYTPTSGSSSSKPSSSSSSSSSASSSSHRSSRRRAPSGSGNMLSSLPLQATGSSSNLPGVGATKPTSHTSSNPGPQPVPQASTYSSQQPHTTSHRRTPSHGSGATQQPQPQPLPTQDHIITVISPTHSSSQRNHTHRQSINRDPLPVIPPFSASSSLTSLAPSTITEVENEPLYPTMPVVSSNSGGHPSSLQSTNHSHVPQQPEYIPALGVEAEVEGDIADDYEEVQPSEGGSSLPITEQQLGGQQRRQR